MPATRRTRAQTAKAASVVSVDTILLATAVGAGVAERFGWTRVGFGDLGAALGLALGLRPRTYFWTLPP